MEGVFGCTLDQAWSTFKDLKRDFSISIDVWMLNVDPILAPELDPS